MSNIKEPDQNPATTWTNGKIAIGQDLVFGYVVLTCNDGDEQARWWPIEHLAARDQRAVVQRVDNNPLFPQELRDWLAKLPGVRQGAHAESVPTAH